MLDDQGDLEYDPLAMPSSKTSKERTADAKKMGFMTPASGNGSKKPVNYG